MSNLLGLEEERPSAGDSDSTFTDAAEVAALKTRASSGANWFYWIAGLSMVNSAIFIFGGNVHFLAGLGITELLDGLVEVSIQQGLPTIIKAVSIAIDIVAVIGFGLVGYFAGRFSRTAFILGIGVYVLDSVIVLLLEDFFMAAFHAFALFGIIRGYLACRAVKAFESAQPASSSVPPHPPDMLSDPGLNKSLG